MNGKQIIIAVTNDLVADQRVHRCAATLVKMGAIPLLVGRKLPSSQEVDGRPYRTCRMRLLFRKGPLFYACYNTRLFFFLLFHKADMLVSNDLDTLPASYMAARIKRLPLVYDSHEYFTEVPELIDRAFTRNIWAWIEKRILPRIQNSYTVCQSIADAYNQKYDIRMEVIRNLPVCDRKEPRRPDLLDCGPKQIIIYQGALNEGRGLENMITAMQYLDAYQLHIFGDGDIAGKLAELRKALNVEDRVGLMGRLPFRQLKAYTRQASLGISIEEDLGLNYRYTLPNKLFDYIQARIPVLVSDLPEMRKVVEQYEIGQILRDTDPEMLAKQVKEMMDSDELRMIWKKNLYKAASELCWENEEEKLGMIYLKALNL